MTRITVYNVVGYALGLGLSIVGAILLIVALWNAWPDVVGSDDIFAALAAQLWTEEFNFGFGFGFKLMEVTILGAALLVLGIFVTVLSRQVFHAGKYIFLKCPFCKNRWKATRARTWAKCPHCNKFIQPIIVGTAE
jgi:uncharacterized membrane protein